MGTKQQTPFREKMLKWLCRFLGVTTGVCAIGWLTGIPPAATDWAVVAGLVGALATGGAAIVAVSSYRDSLDQRNEDTYLGRYSMARRIMFTYKPNVIQDKVEYEEYCQKLSEKAGYEVDRANLEIMAAFDGTATLTYRYEVHNTTIYPVFQMELVAPKLIGNTQISKRLANSSSLLRPEAEAKNLLTIFKNVPKALADDMAQKPQLRFTDIWGSRWRTDEAGTFKLTEAEVAAELGASAPD